MPTGIYKHPPQCGFQKGHKCLPNWGFQKEHPFGKRFQKNHKTWNKDIKTGIIPVNKNRQKLICKICNKPFETILAQVKNGRKYCSFQCMGKAYKGKHHSPKTEFQKEQNRGEKNYKWSGGITPLKNQIRTLFEYRQWRSDVFTRDNFTCILCGKRNTYIEADHYPKPFIIIFNEYKIKTLKDALECAELWNINNGRTLCKECHKKTFSYLNNKMEVSNAKDNQNC